jgi:hypothetical protein
MCVCVCVCVHVCVCVCVCVVCVRVCVSWQLLNTASRSGVLRSKGKDAILEERAMGVSDKLEYNKSLPIERGLF